MAILPGLYLRSLKFAEWPAELNGQFPFNVPAIRSLSELEFTTPVTMLVGENGSGKSTLLELLACATHAIGVGAADPERDPSLDMLRRLAFYARLVWQKRTRKGFFLRAEDFFGYARRMQQVKTELRQDLAAVDEEYVGRSILAQQMAKMPYQSELAQMERSYGEGGLDSQSHGESFLLLFQQRFVPGGLYLLDEPEAPLSPVRQLALLAILNKMVRQDAQFVIATHSPILMALPGARILEFEGGEIRQVRYEDVEHVRLTRDFLNNPRLYLRQLGNEESDED
jgi:predicted ATPase